MNIKRIIFLLIITGAVVAARSRYSAVMEEFQWLKGSWKMESKRGTIIESWNISNDSTLSGISILVNKNLDTSLLEEISLAYRGGNYFYIPVAFGQNNDEPVKFSITAFNESGFVAENPEHDFPKRITYQKVNSDSLFVFIDGGPAQPEKRSNFYFSRLKN